MNGFDFTANDLFAVTSEANEKKENVQADNETILMIKLELEKFLNYKIEVKVEAILFAFQGYEEYLCKPDLERIKFIIPTIENNIKNDLKLKPKCNENTKDGLWVLYSYYNLFWISIINKKHYAAVRYSLKTFLIDPYIARTELFSYIYEKYFEPRFLKEYKIFLSYFPEDPRGYTDGKASHVMLQNYISIVVEKSNNMEEYINERCYKIAKGSLNNFHVFSIIKSLLLR